MTTVYHGSDELFNSFDYAKIGFNGTNEGYGFYFTTSKNIAKGYGQDGYLYTVEFNGVKSLSYTKKTISKAEVKKLLSRLDIIDEYLSNYGDTDYEGYDKVLQAALDNEWNTTDNDVDLISAIAKTFGCVKTVFSELHQMYGYDHGQVTAEWGNTKEAENSLYVALVNEAFTITSVEKL